MSFDDKLISMKLRDAYGLTPEQAMKVVGFIAEENQRAYMEGYNKGFERACHPDNQTKSNLERNENGSLKII